MAKKKPKIDWNPASARIPFGTPLDATYLNAEAYHGGERVPGKPKYSHEPGMVLPVGLHTVKVTYEPDNLKDFEVIEDTLELECYKAAATKTKVAAPTMTYPANGVVTVTVSSTEGTPTGNATLIVDGGQPMTKKLDSSGVATFTLTSPSAGSHKLSASYAAQANFAASDSTTGILTVNPAATTTGLSAPTVTYPANGVVTVTVGSTEGTPLGNATLIVDGGRPLTKELDGSGVATFTLTSPSPGSHKLSASYAAQGNFAASGSTTGILTVNPAATTTGLSAPTVTYPANGVVTVTVGSTAGTPTGNATLIVDSGTPLTQGLNGSGVATFTLTSPSAGSHSLSVSYAGQGNFAASGPTAGALTVNRATPAWKVTGGTFAALGADGNTPVSGSFSLARTEGSTPVTASIQFTSADTNYKDPAPTEIVIPAPVLREITGVIKTRTGGGVPDYEVQLLDLSTQEIVKAKTDLEGRYRFTCGKGPFKVVAGKKEEVVTIP